MARSEARLFPALLRHWRMSRGHSQLDLATSADVSARHISFLETGRAQPSREMVLRLAATLRVPLRDQNAMLRAAGFDAEFPEPSLAGLGPGVTQAIERMLVQHEPFPMMVLDRRYDILRVNQGTAALLRHFIHDPSALTAPPNVYALLFDPQLARPYVVDWNHVAHSLAARLHREVLAQPGDSDLASLLRSLFTYPEVPEQWRQPDLSVSSEATQTVRLRRGALDLSFLTTVTMFNAPQNITLDELRIESYFPLDEATVQACQGLSRESMSGR